MWIKLDEVNFGDEYYYSSLVLFGTSYWFEVWFYGLNKEGLSILLYFDEIWPISLIESVIEPSGIKWVGSDLEIISFISLSLFDYLSESYSYSSSLI